MTSSDGDTMKDFHVIDDELGACTGIGGTRMAAQVERRVMRGIGATVERQQLNKAIVKRMGVTIDGNIRSRTKCWPSPMAAVRTQCTHRASKPQRSPHRIHQRI